MRIMLLFNPIAGAGRAVSAAGALDDFLASAGHEPALIEMKLEPQKEWLDPQMREFELAVIIGGDGAMRLASGAASRTGTPVYHFPLGTENLFARAVGHDRSRQRLAAAIDRFEVRRLDLGIANDRKFLLMASMGFDAEVAYDLATRRGASISHLAYVAPILRQLIRWRPAPLTVHADDEMVLDGEPGTVIVANSRQYAGRLNPAREAVMDDGQLDLIFLPARSGLAMLRWISLCARGRQIDHPRFVHRRCAAVRVTCPRPIRYQLDGDPPESGQEGGSPTEELCIFLRPDALRVLIP